MVIYHLENADMARMFDIDICHLDGLDFPAGWGRIRPGERSASHQHDETEMFVIVSGEGTLLVDGHIYAVKGGSVAQFKPFESHVLENSGEVDLIFFLQYRRDAASAARSAASEERQNPARPQFVFSTPPTPNGDLHLGHLSGPYLGADAYVRYQRLLGNPAWHMSGSDDFQSYVMALANREGKTPADVARYYSQEIRQTLSMMDIEVDHYTVTNNAKGYAEGAQRFFTRLVDSGQVQMRDAPALCDKDSGHYLYEVDVAGVCPGCGNVTNGNICEECGEPNVVTDLCTPITKASQLAPQKTNVKRYMLPLHQFSHAVKEHHKIGRVPARMRELAQRVFSRASLDVPVSHPSNWGIAPAEAEGEGQVIWVWPEMSYGFLWDIEQLGKKINQPWKADQPDESWKIVHFFGYDNSFYHSILYPVLYQLAYPDWRPDIDYHHNEFYLLDGKKFSTSRRHAIWGKEILSQESVDAVRFYLSLTRPEKERTNFQLSAYQEELRQTLIGEWQSWLHDLGQRTALHFAGQAPDAGVWTKEHVAFWAQLNSHLQQMNDALNSDGFSLRRAAQQLKTLVKDTLVFSQSQQCLATSAEWKDEYRTSLALELAAAQLLSRISQPLMPRFADRLAAALGNTATDAWPKQAEIVTPGNAIVLHQVTFFSDVVEQNKTPNWVWLNDKLTTLLPGTTVQPAHRLSDLGVTSLMAVTLQYYLMNEMQVDIPLEFVLNQPLSKLADEMAKQQSSVVKEAIV